MEVKKSPKVDLENKKLLFTQIGLVIALAAVLIAFEWTSTDIKKVEYEAIQEVAAEEEIIPITRQEEVAPPPPPPPPQVIDVLSIVEDNVKVDQELNLTSSESSEETVVTFSKVETPVAKQEDEEEEADAPVFFIVEKMPEFPGGNEALQRYIATSIRYPVIAQENGIQGRVFVSFVVNAKGQVVDVKVARGIDSNLDREALRVVQQMPNWSPGEQRGKKVKVSYTVPINFVLQ